MKPTLPPAPAKTRPPRRTWLAHPWWSLILAAAWLLLQNTLAPVHLLSAALIGLLVPRLLHHLLPLPATALNPAAGAWRVNWRPVPRLVGVVLHDIIQSNLIVARQALGRMDALQPAWLPVPLDAQHPLAVSLLATIITTTPGTISCTIDEDQRLLLVHALHCTDAPAAVADIKQRYEQPLMQIFADGVAPTPQEDAHD